MSLSTSIYNLIKRARATIDTGTDADLAIVLLVDKYNRVFETTDEIFEESLRKNRKLRNEWVLSFLKVFKAYDSLCQNFSSKQISADIYEPLIWILSQTILLLHTMEYLPHAKGAKTTANIKNTRQKKAMLIWQEHKLGRDDTAVIELKRIYKEKTGRTLQPCIRTIREQWMPMWRKNPS